VRWNTVKCDDCSATLGIDWIARSCPHSTDSLPREIHAFVRPGARCDTSCPRRCRLPRSQGFDVERRPTAVMKCPLRRSRHDRS
jgi:hypothetical protein